MSRPRAVQIADAVVEQLNAGGFSRQFTATRKYLPSYRLRDLKDLRVTVVPTAVNEQSESRQTPRLEYEVQIGIQQQVDLDDASSIDPLVALAEEIKDRFRFQRLTELPEAMLTAAEIDPLFVPDELEDKRVFVSIVNLTFRWTGG